MAVDIEILHATPTDAPEIAAIHLSARRQAMPYLHRPFTDTEIHEWFARVVSTPPQAWWVARADTRIVGYMLLNGDILDHLYIQPEWQRSGIGTKLLTKAKTLSPHRLALWAFQRNTNARSFYHKHGFHPVAMTDGNNQEREPDVQYVWTPASRS